MINNIQSLFFHIGLQGFNGGKGNTGLIGNPGPVGPRGLPGPRGEKGTYIYIIIMNYDFKDLHKL